MVLYLYIPLLAEERGEILAHEVLNIPFLKSSKLHFFLTLIFTENSFVPVTVNLFALFRIQECVFVFTGGRLEALIFVRKLSKKASMLFICDISVSVLLSFICHPYLFPSRTAQPATSSREKERDKTLVKTKLRIGEC